MNDTTFQGNGKITYVPVVVNAKPKPITNGDKIRASSDEELAEFLDRWELGDIDYSKTFCSLCEGRLYDCHDDCLLGWLKQGAEDGETAL